VIGPGWLWDAALAALVLIVPGWAIAAALFPPRSVTSDERAVLAVAFSIGAWALGGLLLGLVVGLDRPAWILLGIAMTAGAGLLARARRRARPPAKAPPPPPARPRRRAAVALVAVAVALAGVSIALARDSEVSQLRRAHFSSLWMLPQGGPGRPLLLGVQSHEGGSLGYRLELARGSRTVRSWELRLAPGGSWQARLPAAALGGGGPLVASLLRDGSVYRRVALKAGVAP
jgi:hypothetical protein